ncbi:metallophosphoesterase family protein [Microscilla marina]|uniref:Metallophosphoesterase n=1 Tax=Microscilla marina ATCC 23134 TaxID=313606 RepID=A1ZSE5_MICM2|nr:metallophosphoesterase family protein [Microscilla marina]EAY26693.1 metallophosphoesterase [Microscilla marina ATCC 23134]
MNEENIQVKVTTKPQGRRLVIGDVHGCYRTLKKLIEKQIKLTKDDYLFFLGDFIDRGPDSAAVLDYVFELEDKGFQIFPLRGNHEQMFLDDYQVESPEALQRILSENNTQNLLDKNGQVITAYWDFFQSLPYYYELDDFYLVHAGFNFKRRNPFQDLYSMIWIRNIEIHWMMYQQNEPKEPALKATFDKFKNRKIVFGHTPTSIYNIKHQIGKNKPLIPLDNGCVFAQAGSTELGRLCCLDLDSMELMSQENAENVKSFF